MRYLAAVTILLALSATSVQAQDWPHWRGPNYDGSSTATNLPTKFSKTENVKWVADLPGPGASTPVMVGDHIFLTSIDPEAGALLAISLDRNTGEENWVDVAGSGYRPGGKGGATSLHNRSNYASPSAVTDGELVVFFFGNADMVAYDFEGERVWERNLQKDFGDFAFQWTFSASPTIHEGLIYMPILQRDEPANGIGKQGAESYLLALNAKTGETEFRHVRPSNAVKESLESYATAIPYSDGERQQILVVGGDVITGHDPKDGKELWRWGTWNEGHREAWWRVVPSPVVGGGLALACGPKGAPVCAVKLDGQGTLDDKHLAWKSDGRRDPVTTDVPTPLYFDGDFFVLSDLRNSLTRVDARSGEQRWTIKLPSEHKWRSSPTGADGRLWLMDHGGNVVVVDAEKGEVLHKAAMGEDDADQVRATVVAAGKSLYIRTATKLYRVGE